MNPVGELLQWYNFVFVFPLFTGLLALLVSAYGVAFETGSETEQEADHEMEGDAGVEHELETEAEHELEAEGEHEPDAGVEHEAEADAVHEVEGGAEHEAEHEGETALESLGHGLLDSIGHGWHSTLEFLGAGEAPFTLVLESLLLWWGAIGWLANQLWSQLLPQPELFVWPSLATALLGSVGLTRATARLLGRVLPKESTSALGSEELETTVGEVVFMVTPESGWVQLHDRFGTLHQVAARIEPDQEPIARGCRVLLLRFDAGRGTYLVERADWWDDDRSTEARLLEDEPGEISRPAGRE